MKIGKIERDIPAPTRIRGLWKPFLDEMEIGDSRFVDLEGEDIHESKSTVNRFGWSPMGTYQLLDFKQ